MAKHTTTDINIDSVGTDLTSDVPASFATKNVEKQGEYYIKPRFIRYSYAVTLVDGERVAICGESYEYETKGDKNNAPKKIKVRGATQEDWAKLYKIGHPFIAKRV